MASHYGPGYHFLVKQGFDAQGCGKHKQRIQMPLHTRGHENSYGLGFNPRQQINVNNISNNTSKHDETVKDFDQDVLLPKLLRAKMITKPKRKKKRNSHLKTLPFFLYHRFHDHSTNECQALHYKIRQLIDSKVIYIACGNELYFNPVFSK